MGKAANVRYSCLLTTQAGLGWKRCWLSNKPKFHLLHHDTHIVTNVFHSACSNVADDEEAVMLCLQLKISILCSGFASVSGTTSGKSEVDMSSCPPQSTLWQHS